MNRVFDARLNVYKLILSGIKFPARIKRYGNDGKGVSVKIKLIQPLKRGTKEMIVLR